MEIEAMAMANCLMLLSRLGDPDNPKKVIRGRMFACKTCNREFPSFQALGGHRASHKKLKMLAVESSASPPQRKIHECSICGLEFPIGQALGGHMRRHRGSTMLQGVTDKGVTRMSEANSSVVRLLKKLNSNKRVLCLDLNLSPFENELMLSLRPPPMRPLDLVQ